MRHRVLIIDDNESIHEDFRSLLVSDDRDRELDALEEALFADEPGPTSTANPGYDLAFACQGQEGFHLVEQALANGQRYSLVFVDVRMPPGWDGVKTIQHMWQSDPEIEVVMCSAYSDYSWQKLVTALGASDQLLFMRKPCDPTAVRQAALALTRKWTLRQEMRRQLARLSDAVGEQARSLEHTRDELRRRDAEFERLSKSKSEFLERLSGEIRAPLNQVLGMTQVLAESNLSHEQRRFLGVIQNSGESLLAVIDNILDYSKLTSGELVLTRARFKLRALIDEALERAAERNARRAGDVELAAFVAASVPEQAVGDVARLGQVLASLLDNALQHTTSGSVQIAVSHEPAAPSGARVVFRVTDTGSGISAEQCKRLFAPLPPALARGATRFEGIGLGLTIAKHLVELGGGEAHVQSVVGEGSCFWFSLPCESEPRALPYQQPFTEPPTAALIVGAATLNGRALESYLEEWGITSYSVRTLAEAQAAIQAGANVGLLFVDGSAHELAEAAMISCGATGVKLIALTPSAHAASAVAAGFSGELPLPLTYGALKQVLEALRPPAP